MEFSSPRRHRAAFIKALIDHLFPNPLRPVWAIKITSIHLAAKSKSCQRLDFEGQNAKPSPKRERKQTVESTPVHLAGLPALSRLFWGKNLDKLPAPSPQAQPRHGNANKRNKQAHRPAAVSTSSNFSIEKETIPQSNFSIEQGPTRLVKLQYFLCTCTHPTPLPTTDKQQQT